MGHRGAVRGRKRQPRRATAGRPPPGARRDLLDHAYRRAVARPAARTRQLELGAQAVPPLVQVGCLGPDIASAGRCRRRRRSANARQHRHPGAPLRRRRKGGIQNQALGRSRGGFSTKIHLRTNAEGLPIGVVLTAGEAHDSTAYIDLMGERDRDPNVLLADRAYDNDAIRDDVRARGGAAEIPSKRNRLVQHSVDRALYALRNRIERFINRLKNNRRIATRYDQLGNSYLGFVLLGIIRLWIQFVHAA